MTSGTKLRSHRTTLGFLPSDLANLAGWYEAGDMGLADAAAVSSWPDKSGNARDLAQATGANQPTFRTAVLNGRPVIRFDGGDYVASAAFGAAISQPITVALAMKASSAASTPRITAGNTTSEPVIFVTSTFLSLFAGTTLSSAVAYDTTARVLLAVFNGVSSVLRRDGTQIASGAAGAATLGGFRVGAAANAANFISGDVAEVLVYAADRSSDAQVIERYLGAKYGITVA